MPAPQRKKRRVIQLNWPRPGLTTWISSLYTEQSLLRSIMSGVATQDRKFVLHTQTVHAHSKQNKNHDEHMLLTCSL